MISIAHAATATRSLLHGQLEVSILGRPLQFMLSQCVGAALPSLPSMNQPELALVGTQRPHLQAKRSSLTISLKRFSFSSDFSAMKGSRQRSANEIPDPPDDVPGSPRLRRRYVDHVMPIGGNDAVVYT